MNTMKDPSKFEELQRQGETLEQLLQSTEYSEQEKQSALMEYLNLLNSERAAELGVTFSERLMERVASALEVHPTADIAVDLLYACLLVQQFHSMQFDAWRAHPAIESCRSALQLLELDGKWSDVLRYCQDTSDMYGEISWWPEALYYAKRAYNAMKELIKQGVTVLENGELLDLRDGAFAICCNANQTAEGISESLSEMLSADLGAEDFHAVLEEVQEAKDETVVDPVELTPEYLDIRYELEEKIDDALDHERGYYDFCKEYWLAKRMILRNDYGIRWQSPAQLNPTMEFH
ncbi:MAG: hypothetical protein IK130_02160 [Oscillospiraceae bacterium]|nr:hypothetical protein [Oscillospiraceae bacterium]